MKKMLSRCYIIALVFLLQLIVLGCREVTQSSSMVLDNANSVIKSGSENLWKDPNQAEEENKKKDVSEDKRY